VDHLNNVASNLTPPDESGEYCCFQTFKDLLALANPFFDGVAKVRAFIILSKKTYSFFRVFLTPLSGKLFKELFLFLRTAKIRSFSFLTKFFPFLFIHKTFTVN